MLVIRASRSEELLHFGIFPGGLPGVDDGEGLLAGGVLRGDVALGLRRLLPLVVPETATTLWVDSKLRPPPIAFEEDLVVDDVQRALLKQTDFLPSRRPNRHLLLVLLLSRKHENGLR